MKHLYNQVVKKDRTAIEKLNQMIEGQQYLDAETPHQDYKNFIDMAWP
jgi:hypothetical protein